MDTEAGEIHLLYKFQPIPKAHLLDTDVIVDKIKLMNQTDHLIPVRIQCIPENIRQLSDYPACLFLTRPYQRIDFSEMKSGSYMIRVKKGNEVQEFTYEKK